MFCKIIALCIINLFVFSNSGLNLLYSAQTTEHKYTLSPRVRIIDDNLAELFQKGLAQEKTISDVTNLTELASLSNELIDLMLIATKKQDFNALDKALNRAKVVNLPGEADDQPHLFAITSGEKPNRIDLNQLSDQQIKETINNFVSKYYNMDSVEIFDRDISCLRKEKPFVFSDKQESKRIGKIYEAALASGFLGELVQITNIKRFSFDSHLADVEYLKNYVKRFNGNVTFFLSVEKSYKVLNGDGCGMATMVQAVETVLGKGFLKGKNVNLETDGGEKTRGGNWSALYAYNGAMPTPYNIPYYQRGLTTLGKMRLSHKDFGKDRIYWIASDGDYDISNLNYAGISETELENGGTWSMILHGVAEKIFEDEDKVEIFKNIRNSFEQVKNILDPEQQMKDFEQKLRTYSMINYALDRMEEKELYQLGQDFSDPDTGKLLDFREKPTLVLTLKLLEYFKTNQVIPNAFLLVYDQKSFFEQIEQYYQLIGSKRLGGYGGSYFRQIIEAQLAENEAELRGLAKKDKVPLEVVQATRKIGQEIFPIGAKGKVIAADIGAQGRFADRGKTHQLSGAFIDYMNNKKAEGISGPVLEGNFEIDPRINIIVPSGKIAVLKNVTLRTNKPITLKLEDVMFSNVDLFLSEDLSLGEGSVIVDSQWGVPTRVHGNASKIVAVGINFPKGKKMLDYNQQGSLRETKILHLYPGETVVSMDNIAGFSYLNRVLTNAPYKGETVFNIISKTYGNFENAVAAHPRLLNIPEISDQETAKKVEFIDLKNWLDDQKQPVSIRTAKWTTDYLKHFKRLGLIPEESSQAITVKEKINVLADLFSKIQIGILSMYGNGHKAEESILNNARQMIDAIDSPEFTNIMPEYIRNEIKGDLKQIIQWTGNIQNGADVGYWEAKRTAFRQKLEEIGKLVFSVKQEKNSGVSVTTIKKQDSVSFNAFNLINSAI
ncbi:MAG: hypothetical protein DRP78_04195 [Candidatus Omnitrophota bacterium]|nr:MAG: hypothetical protein DRP78_04195 [Candidatus Omnitrophota bacterium]